MTDRASGSGRSGATTSGPTTFVEDRTHDGRKIRMLNIIDEFTHECLAIRVSRRLKSIDVIDALSGNDGSCIRRRAERRKHVWPYHFVEHRTHDGRKIRMLNIIDEFTHECLAIRVSRR